MFVCVKWRCLKNHLNSGRKNEASLCSFYSSSLATGLLLCINCSGWDSFKIKIGNFTFSNEHCCSNKKQFSQNSKCNFSVKCFQMRVSKRNLLNYFIKGTKLMYIDLIDFNFVEKIRFLWKHCGFRNSFKEFKYYY